MPVATEAPIDRSDLPEFLQGFAAIHDAMFRDAPRLVAAAGSTTNTAGLARWFEGFRREITHHHEREDEIVWPELLRRDETFALERAVLADDHHELDFAMTRAGDALHALAASDTTGTRVDAVAACDAFAVVLVEHLRREEAAGFWRIARSFTAEEYAALEHQLLKATTLRELAFEIPWVFDLGDPVKVAEMLAPVPAPIRFLYKVRFHPAYRRLAAPLAEVER